MLNFTLKSKKQRYSIIEISISIPTSGKTFIAVELPKLEMKLDIGKEIWLTKH
jgi:hypothetical protein